MASPGTPEATSPLTKTIITLPGGFSVRPTRHGDEPSASHHGNNRKIWLNLTDGFPMPYTEAEAKQWVTVCSNPDNWVPTVARLEAKPDNSKSMSANTIITLPDGFSVRPPRSGDEASRTLHANNPNVSRNLTDGFPSPYTEAEAKRRTESAIDPNNWLPTVSRAQEPEDVFKKRQYASRIPKHYGICHNDQYIGSIGIDLEPGRNHVVNMGYWMGEEFWGRGVMTQIVRAFVKWAFETFEWLYRIESDTYGWNIASQKVLSKAGFTHEGTGKLACFKNGKYTDMVKFALLRPGWQPSGGQECEA